MSQFILSQKRTFFIRSLVFVIAIAGILASCQLPPRGLNAIRDEETVLLPQSFSENEIELILSQKQDTIIKTTFSCFQKDIQNEMKKDTGKVWYDRNYQLLSIAEKAANDSKSVHLAEIVTNIRNQTGDSTMLDLVQDKIPFLLEKGLCIVSVDSKVASKLVIDKTILYGKSANNFYMSSESKYLADGVEVFRWGWYTKPAQARTK